MKLNNLIAIFSSLFIAFILTIIKLPSWAEYLRPAWIPLILCYWVLVAPHQVGITTSWVSGLILDALNNTLLGEHALALVIIIYLIARLHRQIRVFPVWQQAFTIMLLLCLYQFTLFWIQGIIGHSTGGWLFWLPALTSAFFWPILASILRSSRQRLRIY